MYVCMYGTAKDMEQYEVTGQYQQWWDTFKQYSMKIFGVYLNVRLAIAKHELILSTNESSQDDTSDDKVVVLFEVQ